jgi:hypothetical protein
MNAFTTWAAAAAVLGCFAGSARIDRETPRDQAAFTVTDHAEKEARPHDRSDGAFKETRQNLMLAFQLDSLEITKADDFRCGAAAVVAGAVLSGREYVVRLVDRVTSLALAGTSKGAIDRSLIDRVRADLDDDGELSVESLQMLEDVVQFAYGSEEATPSTQPNELLAMFAATGLERRPVDVDDVHRAARELRPGEMFVLRYPNDGPIGLLNGWLMGGGGGHLVLIGRDDDGRYYLFDALGPSGVKGTMLKVSEHPKVLQSYLDTGWAKVWGGHVFLRPEIGR